MKKPSSIWAACKWCVRSVGTLALWTLWLGLTLAFGLQLFVAFSQELAVPDFLLRKFERDIAESGLRVTFARTSFDPHGRILVEGVKLALPEYPEPVATARAVYVQLNPWSLVTGRFDPREIRVSGASASVPAMLTPSGGAEEIVSELDATLVPAEKQIGITQLSARVAGIALTAQGAVALPRREPGRPPQSLAELVSTNFPRLARQAIAIKAQLAALEAPALHLDLAPSDTRTAVVNATLFARSLTLENPLVAHIRGLRIMTRLPLIGDAPATSRLELLADEMRLPLQANARGVRASLVGRFRPGGYQFDPRELQVTADFVESSGFSATALAAQLIPQPLPQLHADVVAQIMGAPLAVHARADFAERSATLQFAGAVSPRVLDPLSASLKADVRKYFDFTTLDCAAGEVRLGPGWKFERLGAQVAVTGIDAYHVAMDEGRATIELTPQRLYAPEAFARLGRNFARGSYEQDLKTKQYRFLLAGQLRPLDISGWFREWWPNFFKQFEFPGAAPVANVDVAGVSGNGRLSTEFVAADVPQSVIRGAALDRVQTRLFIRPSYFEGLALHAVKGTGEARGTFTYTTNPETRVWRTLEIDAVSTIDPAIAAKIIGPAGESFLTPFAFTQAPDVKLHTRIDTADAPGGAHTTVDVRTRTAGDFRFHGFPLENASFAAAMRDDELLIEDVQTNFAGGTATGRVKAWGVGANRRLGFDYALKAASLGRAASDLERYLADINHRPPAPPGKFVQEKANVRLDLAASAEGRFADPFSFHGTGNATLQGEEIGEVPLLGLLSSLLKFTALRFTTAQANFKINGPKLEFSEFALRGANSAIDLHGDYLLDRKELDFKAKIFPFQESNSILKSVVGVVLSPISNVFEVKLTGSLAKPEWAFVIGPTNFLRSLPNPPRPTQSRPSLQEASAQPIRTPRPNRRVYLIQGRAAGFRRTGKLRFAAPLTLQKTTIQRDHFG